ncbi:hypothetical protein L6R52_08975 [Myxococcota bacterium]|nr:hypothetical protein [Myxococcota bacterium]
MVLALALAPACTAEERALEDSEVVLRVRDPRGLRGDTPLAWAVAWPRLAADGRSAELGVITGGGRIETSSVTIPLARPGPEVIAALTPRAAGQPWRAVHRARILVYEDVDADGAPDDDDRWLALDTDLRGLGYIADPLGALTDVGLAYEQYFYDATGGRYTPWVRADWTSGYPIVARGWFENVELVLGPPDVQHALVECLPVTPFAGASTSVLLDDALDPALCGLDPTACSTEDLDAIEPPSLETSAFAAYTRTVECHRRGDLASFVVLERAVRCEACRCGPFDATTAYVTTATAAPSWWPCGADVPYCPTDRGLTESDPLCAAAP